MAETDAVTSGRHRLTIRSRDGHDVATTITIEARVGASELADLENILVDPLLEDGAWDVEIGPGQLDIGLIPGVTDTAAAQVVHSASLLGIPIEDASVGRQLDVGPATSDAEIKRRWANPVIERWRLGGPVEPGFAMHT